MLNPPFLPDYFTPFPFAAWPNAFAPSGFPVLTVTQQNLRTPYAQHFNLGIEHELAGKMVLGVAYVGTTGTKLPRFRQIDQAYINKAQIDTLSPDVVTRMELIGIPPAVAQFLYNNQLWASIPSVVRTPYFGFAQLFQAEDVVSWNYHSLQAKLDNFSVTGFRSWRRTPGRTQLTAHPCSLVRARMRQPSFPRTTTI